MRDRGLGLGHAPRDDLLDARGLLDGHLAAAALAGGRLAALGLRLGLLLGLGLLVGLRVVGRGRLLGELGLAGLRLLGLRRLGLPVAAGRRRLDVGLHYPPAGPGALERREVDAVLARDPPCDRRGLRAPAVAVGGGRLGLGGRAARLAARVAVRAAVAVGRRLGLLRLVLLGRGLLVRLVGVLVLVRRFAVVLALALVLGLCRPGLLGALGLLGLRRGPAAVTVVVIARVALGGRLLTRGLRRAAGVPGARALADPAR